MFVKHLHMLPCYLNNPESMTLAKYRRSMSDLSDLSAKIPLVCVKLARAIQSFYPGVLLHPNTNESVYACLFQRFHYTLFQNAFTIWLGQEPEDIDLRYHHPSLSGTRNRSYPSVLVGSWAYSFINASLNRFYYREDTYGAFQSRKLNQILNALHLK